MSWLILGLCWLILASGAVLAHSWFEMAHSVVMMVHSWFESVYSLVMLVRSVFELVYSGVILAHSCLSSFILVL